MSEYTIELSSEPINGSMNYKRKFNMSGDIDGGGASALVLESDDNDTLNKTWQEINDAMPLVWLKNNGYYYPCTYCNGADDSFGCSFYDADYTTSYNYSCSSATDKPVKQSDPG